MIHVYRRNLQCAQSRRLGRQLALVEPLQLLRSLGEWVYVSVSGLLGGWVGGWAGG